MNVIDLIDYPQVRYGATFQQRDHRSSPARRAAAARPICVCGCARAMRSTSHVIRIGCNKLFLGYDGAGQLIVASRAVRGVASRCRTLVAQVVSPRPRDRGLARKASATWQARISPMCPPARSSTSTRFANRYGKRWTEHLHGSRMHSRVAGLRCACPEALDSSVIASLAALHLPGTVAASFTYLDAEDLRRHALGAPADQLASASDDFRCAARVAEALGNAAPAGRAGPAKRWPARSRPRSGFAKIGAISTFTARR